MDAPLNDRRASGALADGNFRVPRAAAPMEFTGERMTGAAEGQIEFEHFHRYCFARDLCAGLDVLDVAAGEGYGAAMLAGTARSVVGVEIDAAAVAHAEASYAGPALRFVQGDALALPLPDASVDAAVSFETLEHLRDQGRFLAEIRRVLRPGGLFVVSTPDRAVYSAPGADPNPYHVLELTDPELRALLGGVFAHVEVLAQRPALGSVLASASGARWRSYERRRGDVIEATSGLARAHYLVAVATDGPMPELASSIYLDWRRVHDVVQDSLRLAPAEARAAALEAELSAAADSLAAAGRRAAEAEAGLDAARAHVASLDAAQETRRAAEQYWALATQHAAKLGRERDRLIGELTTDRQAAERALGEAEARIAGLEAGRAEMAAAARDAAGSQAAVLERLARSEAERTLLAHAVEAARAERDAVVYSTGWRLLAPLRSAGRRHPGLARALRRAAKLAWWTATLQVGRRYKMWRRRLVVAAPAAPPPAQLAPLAPLPSAPEAKADPQAESPAPPRAVAPAPLPNEGFGRALQVLNRATPIHFPPVEAPEVSVVVPVYKGLAVLQDCLRSLAASVPGEPGFEVILIDDCPEEQSLWAVPNSGGLRKVYNAENKGFLLTCNGGAGVARGRILCFLNSDTMVTPGWLRNLVDALDGTPGAALAGGMALNMDGTVQEAGWRIMGDGWGHPIGRGADKRDGAYTYRRPADCVTGACFVIARSLFEEMGGFDPFYAPAFYEEFDLAFRARRRGLQAIYEPKSRIVHRASQSYGPERRDRLSGEHHAIFAERFATELRKQPWDKDDDFALRHGASAGPVLLVVDHGVPSPDRHAGDVTMTQYLGILADAGWSVVFGPADGVAEGPAADALERRGIELIRFPRTIEGWLSQHGRHVREAWLARPEIAERLVGQVRARTDARIAYYPHDLHHVRLQREARLREDPALEIESARERERELFVLGSVDHVMSPSAEEAELIRRLAPQTPVTVLPAYCYESHEIAARPAGHFAELADVVFVGGFPHTPNVDAALFIARDVMPAVWRRQPRARLVLVGYAPPPEVLALAGPRVVVTGQVPRVEPFLDAARLVLAAVRYGAGVKGKVVEAMRLGVPVVTTPVGAEGTGIVAGRDALVAEDADGLAAHVLALFDDPARCAALSDAGAALVRDRFSRRIARTALDEVFRTPRCAVCGSGELFGPPDDGDGRESDGRDSDGREGFVCRNCFALRRAEALARVVLARLARDGEGSLAELARRGSDRRVHEFGFVGSIADTLRGHPWFSTSEFFDDVPVGQAGPGGVRCEDVGRLTFPDASFDLVISQEVLEHVPDPAAAFAESARVLRPGGSHVFTVPQNRALAASVTRARLGPDGVEHLLPPEYHGDPVRAQGALVFTEFGKDLPAMVEAAGLRLVEHEVVVLDGGGDRAVRVFEASKPG